MALAQIYQLSEQNTHLILHNQLQWVFLCPELCLQAPDIRVVGDGHLAGVSGAHHDLSPLHCLLAVITGPLLEGESPDPDLADLGGLCDAHPHTVAGQPQLWHDVHLMMMIIKVNLFGTNKTLRKTRLTNFLFGISIK